MMFNKIKDKIINKKIIEKLLLFFMMLQPILDLYFLFDEKIVNLFGFSPSTIIRILFVGIIGILFLFVLRSKKEFWTYFLYIGMVLIYTIIHHFNALNFTNFYDGYDFGYSLVSELFYLIRMLMPLFLIVVSSHYEFDDKYIGKLITILIFLICGSIIITNLLEISTGSYSKQIIGGNIFCWFDENRCYLNYMDLASKGFFNDPNRLSALLVLITPLTIYTLIKNPTLKNKTLLLLNLIGGLMIGTKVSTYGFLILTLLSLGVYLFFTIIKKEIKFKLSTFVFITIIFISNVVILPYSPAINRTYVDQKVHEEYNSDENGQKTENQNNMDKITDKINKEYPKKENKKEPVTEEEKTKEKEKKQLLIEFVGNNYEKYSIHSHFILKSYPYQYDPEFWYDVMKMDIESRTNFRNLEKLMLERVKEINNNKLDNYFGITFTRMGNIFDLERDFVSHYYTLGIVGLILFVIPYIIVILICLCKMLINFKECFNLKNVFYLMGIGISLGAAYFTGNVLDGLIVTLILGVMVGQLINSCFNLKNVFTKDKN